MSSILPHSDQLKEDALAYLRDAQSVYIECIGRVSGTAEYRKVFKYCMATDAVLSKLSTSRERPRLSSARGLIQRVPLLVAGGQLPSAQGELRRFIEIIFWSVYFSDHPIEWRLFEKNPSQGHVRETSNPIAF